MKNKLVTILSITVLLSIGLSPLYSQIEISSKKQYNDSLKDKTYKDLENLYYKSGNNFALADFYANSYLNKAKKQSNKKEIGNAFYLLSQTSDEKKSIKLADSLLYYGTLTKDTELIIKGYIQKGISFYYLAQYDEALSQLLKAQKMAVSEKKKFLQVIIKHNIGNLKNVTNQRAEALQIFRTNIKYFNKEIANNEERRQYLKSLFRLGNSYNVNKKLDSAEIINRLGIQETIKTESKYMYPMFLACYGSTMQLMGKTDIALDSIQKSATLINNRKARLASIYLIICKILNEKNDQVQYENYLLKIDSLYNNHPETIKETKIAYEALIEFYRKKKATSEQLIYMDKLIKVDSILDIKFQNVNKNIARKYESSELISEKENIIDKLNKNKRQYIFLLSFMALSLLLSVFLGYRFYKKKKDYKTLSDKAIHEVKNKQPSKQIKNSPKNSISKEILANILNGLEAFENKNEFLEKNISLKRIAEDLSTNTTYLSYAINNHKQKNFSKYISDLRIDYCINRLKKDQKFRKYSIKAISYEIGFKSQEAFSKAFHKKTGLYPSYFIKKIEENITN